MKVLVTGATGFVGGHVARALRQRGLAIRALIRPGPAQQEIDWHQRGVEVTRGRLEDSASLTEAVQGVDAVVHSAALMSNWEERPYREFHEVNVEGTGNLLKALHSESPQALFLHISTVNVLGPTPSGPATEEASYGPCRTKYSQSKRDAELLVRAEKDVSWVILRPAQLYGEYMQYGWPQTLEMIKAGHFFIFGDGKARMHLTHVSDIVEGVILALEKGEAVRHRIYHLAGPSTPTLKEVFEFLAKTLKSKSPRTFPYTLAAVAAQMSRFLPSAFKPASLKLLNPQTVQYFKFDHVYSIDKARKELGYTPRIFYQEGMQVMVNSFLGQSHVLSAVTAGV